MALLRCACWILAAALTVQGEPSPGRVPKVYNALITSGQNLAPSKSFPIYQPVYHEAFGFPLQPSFYYGESDFKSVFDLGGPQLPSLQPPPGSIPPGATDLSGASDKLGGDSAESSSPGGDAAPYPSAKPEDGTPTGSPPPPPATQSPIPLNDFGLPPSIVPLSRRLDRPRPTYAFDPYAQFSPYYPQFDPYADPFSYRSSYPLLPPVYRFGEEAPPPPSAPAPPAPAPSAAAPADAASAPPPAPSDLDINNYSGKDPAIPDVPPPPLPSGGLKNDAKTN